MQAYCVDQSIIPSNEAARLAALRRYDILDTPPDGVFDRVTAMAARRLGVPIAIVSLVDEDRIWFKSHHGLAVEQIERAPGLCASAILGDDPYILENAAADPRSLANPLVAGDFGLKFYAGVPLQTRDGYNLGTLCVIDRKRRTIDQDEIEELKALASMIMDQMELRLSARNAVATAEMLAREIDHRVMNSLQFVSSMLTLQSRTQKSQEAAAALKEAANRVAAVARVHRHSHTDNIADSVSSIVYLGRLCEDLSGILGISVTATGDELAVPRARVQPIGLIVNELAMNAAKHGTDAITVSYRQAGDEIELAVADRGTGLPDGFDLKATPSGLGMKIVGALASQLGGRFEAMAGEGGRGARFVITFPVGDPGN